MLDTMDPENQSERDRIDSLPNGGSFNYLSLSVYAQAPSGSKLFRVQHSELLMHLEEMRSMACGGRDNALEIRNKLTSITGFLTVHLSMEDNIVHKQMLRDQRARSISEQFEREMSPIKSSVYSYLKKYATPSFIANNLPEFIADTEQQLRVLQDRFKAEERDLFVSYDRLVRPGHGA